MILAGTTRPFRHWLPAVCCAAMTTVAGAQSIENLGTLAGYPESQGIGVNANGSVVVGWVLNGQSRTAFRWTRPSGMQTLGTTPSGSSLARRVSDDGNVVTGDNQGIAFRWTSQGGLTSLGVLAGSPGSTGQGLSADGSVVVGTCAGPLSLPRAFRWTTSLGMREIPNPYGQASTTAVDVSADGNTVLCYGSNTPQSITTFLWRTSQPVQTLGNPAGGAAMPNSISSAATAACGQSSWRWTSAAGFSNLGFTPLDMSGDGNTIVGVVVASPNRAALWTATGGQADLTSYLASRGLNMSDWVLHEALGVSRDGQWITGYGSFQGVWRAFLVSLCAPLVTTQPQPRQTCAGGTVQMSMATTGSSPFTYQWQWRPLGTTDWLPIANGLNNQPGTGTPAFAASNTSTATITMANVIGTSQAASGRYREIRATTSNSCGAITSQAALWKICPGDFNCSSAVDVSDIFDFLAAWFGGDASGDFNGAGGINVTDIFDFVAAWFAGC